MKVVFNLTENDMLFAATMISYEYNDPDKVLAKIRQRIEGKDTIEVDTEIFTNAAGNDDKQLRLALASMGVLSLCKDILDK